MHRSQAIATTAEFAVRRCSTEGPSLHLLHRLDDGSAFFDFSRGIALVRLARQRNAILNTVQQLLAASLGLQVRDLAESHLTAERKGLVSTLAALENQCIDYREDSVDRNTATETI